MLRYNGTMSYMTDLPVAMFRSEFVALHGDRLKG